MTRIQKTHNRIKNNSGFTLIELLVVLILLGILLSVTIVGGLAWQDWAQFRHEEAVAEEIFYAAQNQLTELDSSGALYYNVTKELEKGATGSNKYNSTYMIPEFENVVYKAGENGKYRLNTIWINTNLTTEPGELLKLQASAGDYDKYLKGSLGSNTSAKLLFDLVSPYVSDKSVLNGAIIIEFSPEAGQVFSVCYSDRASSLVYADGDTDAEGNVSISVMNRIMQEREKVMLGYYSVDNITQKVRGRGNNAAELDFQIQNKEVLQFVITDKENKLVSTDSLMFNIYDGTTSKEVMEFKVPYSAIKVGASYKDGLDAATKNPAVVSVEFKNNIGKYSGSKGFRIPVFFDNTTQKYYVIMDAADVQAETISYSKSIYFGGTGEDEEAFRNTYSFYRFGLSEAVSSIYGTVKISHSGGSSTGACDSYSDASVGFHKDQSGVKGECATFASYKQTGDEVSIDLTNIRHLYNVRYETDYKTASRKTIKNTFNVKADMSWASFVSKNSDTGINYFLNSYSASDVSIKSGINYSGANISPDLNSKATTKNYPFPGFRKLDKYDKFTQAEDTNYAISDLYISVTGNITYGVYDTEADAISTKCSSDYKYTQGEKANYTELNSEGNNAARAGKMPLGLFAENQGEISNIILNRHVVKGLEQMNNSGQDIVYTCMVGGFAGNNLGKISNLTLLDNTSNDSTSAKANKTVINGRTDVGGIIGRQSFVVSESNRNITISKMKNYGTVSGLENIGGIVGRVYTRFVTDKTDVPERFSEVYGSATYNSSSVSTYAQVTNKYFYFHDGYNITDSYKSMTGEDVYRNDKVVISECMNRGKISGDSLAYKMIQNNTRIRVCKSSGTSFENVNLRACAFIGGIVGASIDGIMYDDESLKVNDRNLYPEICESYANGGEANIQLIDCNSFPEYNTSSMTALVSSEANSIKYDNYVGGLIGYGRLTSIENCNDKPDDVAKDDGVPRAFVIGHRYVGGVVGCSDGVRYDVGNASANSDGVNNRKYSVTNYNNVIGCTFVGGIAGSNGKGFYKYGNLCFRNPATSSAEMPTRIPGVENSPALLKNTLNTGSVICLKKMLGVNNAPDSFTLLTSDYWANIESSPRENYCGHCGGILGVNTDKIRNTDNIQSEATKNYIVKTINGSELDYTNVDINAVVSKMDSSVFGGVSVGGIVGYQNGNGQGKHSINEESSDASYVDAVVYGQNYVGGVAGCVQNGDYPKFDNVYPVKKSDSSSGMLVLGEDCVGGLVGRLQRDLQYHNAESITSAFTVIGRYSVGGYVGFDGYDSSARGVVNTSLELNNGTVKVYGKCYVGGLLGYSSAKHIDIPEDKKVISINNIDVSGEYFVGGIAGGIAARDKDGSTDHNILFVKRLNVGDNINVQATSFAGGVAGLYTSTTGNHNEFLSHDGKPFKLANEFCKYAGTNAEKLTGTYNKVVLPDNADITTTDIFDKSDRDVSLDFANYTNKVNVTTKLFGGGLFGYVPNGLKITVKGFSNNGNILVTSSLPVSVVTESADKNPAITYSYLGGVIGRVPAGMKIVNCYNLVSGTDKYNSMGTYLGGLTEVNAGVISGDVETDDNGTVTKVNSYLENNTEYKYGSGGIGAFAGVNGTTSSGCDGVIQYVQNRGNISSNNGTASGIAAVQSTTSKITDSINLGDITSTNSIAAGMVASPSGQDEVSLCRNYGKITGSSKFGIAGGVVGTLTDNLEASGLNEINDGTPIASRDNTNFRKNFYIYGDENSVSDSSGEWYQINFLEYYLKKNPSNGAYYYDIYSWYYKQSMMNAHVENANDMYPEFQSTYSWTKDIVLAHFNNNTDKYHQYSALVCAAYLTIRNQQGVATSIRDYLDFYHYIVVNNTIPGDLYTPSYYNTEAIWITERERSGLFITSFNDSISAEYETTVIPDEKFDSSTSWVKEAGNDTYYKLYFVSSFSPLDTMNNIVQGNDSVNCALYPNIPDAYITIFNGNLTNCNNYIAKLFAYYEVQHGGDLFRDWGAGRLPEFASFVNEQLGKDCARTLVYPEGIELIQGGSYTPHWPLQLYSIANGSNWDLKYRNSTGTVVTTSITELTYNPITFPDSLNSRIDTYIESGLDDDFVTMTKTTEATNYISE